MTLGSIFLAVSCVPFRPAELLRLEAVNVRGQLGWADDARYVGDAPPRELRAVAQVEIFGDRVVLPAAGFLDALGAQQRARAVEAEEQAAEGPDRAVRSRTVRRGPSPSRG